MKKTHKVIDTFYTEDEGQECYTGTHLSCLNFILEQEDIASMYKIVPLTKAEFEFENSANLIENIK